MTGSSADVTKTLRHGERRKVGWDRRTPPAAIEEVPLRPGFQTVFPNPYSQRPPRSIERGRRAVARRPSGLSTMSLPQVRRVSAEKVDVMSKESGQWSV